MANFLPVLQVSEHLYRSPQPDFEDMLRIKEQGIRAVVNLRDEAPESEFFARQCCLEYLYLPVIDWALPSADQIAAFLRFVDQSANRPALVHCAAGVGRTGTFVACYRIAQGMPIEEALRLTNGETPLPGVGMNDIQLQFVRDFQVASR